MPYVDGQLGVFLVVVLRESNLVNVPAQTVDATPSNQLI